MARHRIKESEINFKGEDRELDFLKKAVKNLPLKKLGLELFNEKRAYTCKRGKLGSVMIQPDHDILHSIWVPEDATNIHSTEDYQAFSLYDVDYFIYRRPRHHIKKIYVY